MHLHQCILQLRLAKFRPHPLSAQGGTAGGRPASCNFPGLEKFSDTTCGKSVSPSTLQLHAQPSRLAHQWPTRAKPKTERSNLKIATTWISSWPARNTKPRATLQRAISRRSTNMISKIGSFKSKTTTMNTTSTHGSRRRVSLHQLLLDDQTMQIELTIHHWLPVPSKTRFS